MQLVFASHSSIIGGLKLLLDGKKRRETARGLHGKCKKFRQLDGVLKSLYDRMSGLLHVGITKGNGKYRSLQNSAKNTHDKLIKIAAEYAKEYDRLEKSGRAHLSGLSKRLHVREKSDEHERTHEEGHRGGNRGKARRKRKGTSSE